MRPGASKATSSSTRLYCRVCTAGARRDMDYQGQKLAEDIYQVVIAAFSVVAFIAGYWQGCVRARPACCRLAPSRLPRLQRSSEVARLLGA